MDRLTHFSVDAWTDAAAEKAEGTAIEFQGFASWLDATLPEGRYKSLAFTKLEEAFDKAIDAVWEEGNQ